jgi:hypothetical protein
MPEWGGAPPFKTKALLYLWPSEKSHCSSKPFRSNTYTVQRKCSFQRTYGIANFFRCNTYKNRGVAMVKPHSLIFNSPPIQAQYGLQFRGKS